MSNRSRAKRTKKRIGIAKTNREYADTMRDRYYRTLVKPIAGVGPVDAGSGAGRRTAGRGTGWSTASTASSRCVCRAPRRIHW